MYSILDYGAAADKKLWRGQHPIMAAEVNNVTPDTVRVFFAPEVAHRWEGAPEAENSPGLQVVNCNF